MSDCGHTPPWPDDFPADSPVRTRLGWSLGTSREALRRVRDTPCPTCRMRRLEALAAAAPKWVNPMHTEEPT